MTMTNENPLNKWLSILEKSCNENNLNFSNEADLINRIVLGSTASKYRKFHDIPKGDAIRDYLTQSELDCIISLQRANTVYIEDGLDFQERKDKLTSLYNRKHKENITNEIHLLNA